MKTFTIVFLLLATSIIVLAGEDTQQKRSKAEWYRHIDERLASLEEQLAADMEAMQEQQKVLTEEMLRLNSKLENRFDKYFLWGLWHPAGGDLHRREHHVHQAADEERRRGR